MRSALWLVLAAGFAAGFAALSCSGAEQFLHRGSDGGIVPVGTGGTGLIGSGGSGPPGGTGGSVPTGGSGGIAGSGGAGGTGAVGGTGGATGGAGGATGGSGGAGGRGGAGGSGGSGGSGGAGGAGGSGGAGGAGGTGNCSGRAVQFDGVNDVLTIARQIQDDFTMEAWIKTTTPSPAGTFAWQGNGIFHADVSGPADDFVVSVLVNRIAFAVHDAQIQSTTSVTTGQWFHLAVTRTRATGAMALLINGVVEANQLSGQTASLTAPANIALGANPIDSHFFNGTIDEIRFWNVPRTPAQIQANMNGLLTGIEAGLVGYWRLDETAGAIADDLSPSNNNATGNAAAMAVPAHVVSDAPITRCP